MKRYAAVTDYHITVYAFSTHPIGKPQIDDGRMIEQIRIPDNIGRSHAAYDKLLRRNEWVPIGTWGFAWCASRHSEQPCVELL